MENNEQGNYSRDDSNPQNEKEKHLDTARLNVDSERKTEDLKSDTDPNSYYNKDKDSSNEDKVGNPKGKNNWSEGPAETSGKESSYRSPEDERAFNTKNTEKYITEDNPDSKEASDSKDVKSLD